MRPLAKGFAVIGGCMFALAVVANMDHKQTPQTAISNSAPLPDPTVPSPPPKPLTPAEKRKAEAEQRQAALLQDKADEQARIVYAKVMENRLLGAGYDVDMTAYGPKHKFLKLKWVLTNKVLAYQFSHSNSEMWGTMRNAGFAKFTITDGYDSSWYWDLTK